MGRIQADWAFLCRLKGLFSWVSLSSTVSTKIGFCAGVLCSYLGILPGLAGMSDVRIRHFQKHLGRQLYCVLS